MVQHPAKYPWSSYRANAMGQSNKLVTPHEMYHRLGDDEASRQAHYRCLFEAHTDELSLHQLREATNKAWVLGSEYFKQKVAQ